MQQLNRMGFPEVDHPTLYRELRRLEREGHVSSEWQTDGSGPAKRVYSITEAGEELLKGWSEVVSGYQRMINGFLICTPSFLAFPQTRRIPGKGIPRERATIPRRVEAGTVFEQ